MNKNTEKLMNDIDKCMVRVNKKAYLYFRNIDEIKKECEKNLGFTEDYFWHMNFNSNELKHLKNVFGDGNCFNFAKFNGYIEDEFNRISDITGIDKNTLIFMYNDYLKNKYKK